MGCVMCDVRYVICVFVLCSHATAAQYGSKERPKGQKGEIGATEQKEEK